MLTTCNIFRFNSFRSIPRLQFCAENGIVLLADEVYQRNVYDPSKEFVSAKKVALEVSQAVVSEKTIFLSYLLKYMLIDFSFMLSSNYS